MDVDGGRVSGMAGVGDERQHVCIFRWDLRGCLLSPVRSLTKIWMFSSFWEDEEEVEAFEDDRERMMML